jgi:hypothetical protein
MSAWVDRFLSQLWPWVALLGFVVVLAVAVGLTIAWLLAYSD